MAISIPDNYLFPETREGEFIDVKKKKLFKISIDILEEIKKVCERHNLRYFAAYGTLLGAIRHKGFIPWDDDMDLWMPREDYDVFKEVAGTELPQRYFMQTALTDPEYTGDIIKIRDSLSTATVSWMLLPRCRVNMGIWVDIFPLDGACDTDFEAEVILARKWWYRYLQYLAFRRTNRTVKAWLWHVFVRIVISIIGLKRLNKLQNKLNYRCPFVGSEFCTTLSNLFEYNHFNCPTKAFNEYIEVPYEYTRIRVPKDYEMVLKALYDDWHVIVKGGAVHEIIDLEPDIPYKKYVKEHYGYEP